MSRNVLFVGGCSATYHLLEPAEIPIRQALEAIGLSVDVTGITHPDAGEAFIGDYSALSAENIQRYDAIVLYTTGREERGADVAALIDAVRGGKALVAIHCGADSFNTNPDYVAMVGGLFRTHPAPLNIDVEFVDTQHPITVGLEPFRVHDELYLFQDYDPSRVHLLAQTQSFDDNGPVPVCWVREEGAGRIFYLSLGHFPTVMANTNWQVLFQRGITWALKRDPQALSK